jgi:hypothetical protein
MVAPQSAPVAQDDTAHQQVRLELARLVTHGVDDTTLADAVALHRLPAVGGADPADPRTSTILHEALQAAIGRVSRPKQQTLLRIVLGLDPAVAGLTVQERRRIAGEQFRGGHKTVKPGTIRTYYEPRALEALATALLELGPPENAPMPSPASRVRGSVRTHAFGDPDGARADPSYIASDFIVLNFIGTSHDHLFADLDSRARVIVGRKGSGKTHYLRRLQLINTTNASAYSDAAIYTDQIATDVPSTAQVVEFTRRLRGERAGPWRLLWHVAILRSVLSHITRADRLSALLGPTELEELQHAYERLGGRETIPKAIGAELRDLLHGARGTGRELERLVHGPAVDEAEYLLGETIGRLPPMYFYMDGLDDEFQHAPSQWLACQAGLFLETMRLLRDARLGARLHVIVALRDTAYDFVASGEHASRFRDSPHIVHLRWTQQLAEEFLRLKVKTLPSTALGSPVAASPIEAWLGRARIRDPSSRRHEPVERYLVTHTRALPRDIVILGNRLCRLAMDSRESGEPLTDERIVHAVEQSARMIGAEQLAILATQLTSVVLAADTATDAEEYSDLFGVEGTYSGSLREQLARLFVPYASGEHISRPKLREMGDALQQIVDYPVDLASFLWQNDSLGLLDDDGTVTYRHEYADELDPTRLGERRFTLHPVLRAALVESMLVE